MNLKCYAMQELKSSTIDSKSIMGGGEKDNDFMPDLQKTSPGKLAAVATTQESALYSTRKILAATT
jgi:hypothetical protein